MKKSFRRLTLQKLLLINFIKYKPFVRFPLFIKANKKVTNVPVIANNNQHSTNRFRSYNTYFCDTNLALNLSISCSVVPLFIKYILTKQTTSRLPIDLPAPNGDNFK